MYKAAIIGFGNIGYLLSKDKKRKNVWSHFEAYKKIKKTKLIAIVEVNKKKRNFIKKNFPKIIIFKSLSKLLNSKTTFLEWKKFYTHLVDKISKNTFIFYDQLKIH